jgi:hypothetical protein
MFSSLGFLTGCLHKCFHYQKSKRMKESVWRREHKDKRKRVRESGKKRGKWEMRERKREGEINKRTKEQKPLPNR